MKACFWRNFLTSHPFQGGLSIVKEWMWRIAAGNKQNGAKCCTSDELLMFPLSHRSILSMHHQWIRSRVICDKTCWKILLHSLCWPLNSLTLAHGMITFIGFKLKLWILESFQTNLANENIMILSIQKMFFSLFCIVGCVAYLLLYNTWCLALFYGYIIDFKFKRCTNNMIQ